MTNPVKQSLEENKAEILKNLPEEFHDDLNFCIESSAPTSVLTDEEAKEQAKQLLTEDPNILHEACLPLIDEDIQINRPINQPSEAELELQKAELIAEIEASLEAE